jgi:hypothetical protein
MQGRKLLKKVELFVEKMGVLLHIHPPFADLAPSDFFLFGHVTNRLHGIIFQ